MFRKGTVNNISQNLFLLGINPLVITGDPKARLDIGAAEI
jgi:hypothetical protein